MNSSELRRDTWFAEENILARFLRSLESTDQLALPVCVEHRDQLSPDFVLCSRNTQIGLEVTCSTDEELIRAQHILMLNPAPFIDVTGLKDTGQRRSNDAIKNTMSDLNSPWVYETDILVHKLGKITQAIDRKRRRFRSQDFEKFGENWLLIYDDYSRFTSGDSSKCFRDGLERRLRYSKHEFERVYIFHGEVAHRWHNGKLSWKRVMR
jgi:hypothetical protein